MASVGMDSAIVLLRQPSMFQKGANIAEFIAYTSKIIEKEEKKIILGIMAFYLVLDEYYKKR